jgi:hypothetical protein
MTVEDDDETGPAAVDAVDDSVAGVVSVLVLDVPLDVLGIVTFD